MNEIAPNIRTGFTHVLASTAFFVMMATNVAAQQVAPVGVISAANGPVFVRNDSNPKRVSGLVAGDPIFVGDELATEIGTQAQFLLGDGGGVLSLSGKSSAAFGQTSAEVRQGKFQFVSVDSARNSSADAPVVLVVGGAQMRSANANIAGQVDAQVSGLETDRRSEIILLGGRLEVVTDSGLQTLTRAGFGVDVGADGKLGSPRRISRTALAELIGDLQPRQRSGADRLAALGDRQKQFQGDVARGTTKRLIGSSMDLTINPRIANGGQRGQIFDAYLLKQLNGFNAESDNEERIDREAAIRVEKKINQHAGTMWSQFPVFIPSNAAVVVNKAATAITLSTSSLPDQVLYPTLVSATTNLVTNPTLAQSADGWTLTDALYSSHNQGILFKLLPGSATQTISLDTAFAGYQPDLDRGGTISWAVNYDAISLCGSSIPMANCSDQISASVTAFARDGLELATQIVKLDAGISDYNETVAGDFVIAVPLSAIKMTLSAQDMTAQWSSLHPTVMKAPSVIYNYNKAQDTVVAFLAAVDGDAGDSHSYVLASDPSGKFKVQGNQLVLNAGSTFDRAVQSNYALSITVTDSYGNDATLPLSIAITDAGGTPSSVSQNLVAVEDGQLVANIDFGQSGAALSGVNLPTWITLNDLGNGRGTLTGSPPDSGAANFQIVATKNGATTTIDYQGTVSDSCTSAYCTQFASSIDSQKKLTSTDLTMANFASWNDVHKAFASGTAQFSRTGAIASSNGSWNGTLAADIDFSQRTADITSSGSFSGYTDGGGASASGSWTAAFTDQSFASGGSGCSVVGGCSYAAPHNGSVPADIDLKTCTGGAGYCSANNHPSVAIAPEILVQLNTVSAGGGAATNAALGQTIIRDRNAATSSQIQAADAAGQLLEAL